MLRLSRWDSDRARGADFSGADVIGISVSRTALYTCRRERYSGCVPRLYLRSFSEQANARARKGMYYVGIETEEFLR